MSDIEPIASGASAPDAEVALPPTATLAVPAPDPAPPAATSRLRVDLGHPFTWGFFAAAGALVAVSLGGSMAAVSTVLVSIGAALFVALALEPLVRWLSGHGMSRGLSIGVVFGGFALIFGIVLAIVAPIAVTQIAQFAAAVPTYVADIQNSDWFRRIGEATGQGGLYESVLDQARSWLSNPENLLALGGGALAVGTGVVGFISTALIVLVLTLYFLASMPRMKIGLQQLAPAYSRERLGALTDQIAESVGGYVSGMAILAALNAVFAFILLTVLGAPFAALLAFLALFITFIPMVGPVIAWLLITAVTLVSSPWTALIFAIVYFAYMQVEAYVMTPRLMSKAVDIPGSLVLIGAMVGGTLLGLLGALVAVPVTASILLIIKDIFIPRQDAKLVPEA